MSGQGRLTGLDEFWASEPWQPNPHTLAKLKSFLMGFEAHGRPIYCKRKYIAARIGIAVRTLARYLRYLRGWLDTIKRTPRTAIRKVCGRGRGDAASVAERHGVSTPVNAGSSPAARSMQPPPNQPPGPSAGKRGGKGTYLRRLSYDQFLLTPYWKRVSAKVRRRAGNRCELCPATRGLHVHHKTYEHHGLEDEHLDDLICLCGNCHALVHSKLAVIA